jgi:hypothetical protein
VWQTTEAIIHANPEKEDLSIYPNCLEILFKSQPLAASTYKIPSLKIKNF